MLPKAPLVVPETFVEMDENFLRLSVKAGELSTAIMENKVGTEYPDAVRFIDEPDEALIVKIDSICFAPRPISS